MNFIDNDENLGETKVRVLADTGNNKLYGRQKDPYGFISLNWDKGQLPEEMQGVYTTWPQAERAVEAYLKDKALRAKAKEVA